MYSLSLTSLPFRLITRPRRKRTMTKLRSMKQPPAVLTLLALLAASTSRIPNSFGLLNTNLIVAQAADVEEETCSAISTDGSCSAVADLGDGESTLVEEEEQGHEAQNDYGYEYEYDYEESYEYTDEFEDKKDCADDEPNCSFWASNGDCESLPGYMTHHCAASCNSCDALSAAAWNKEFAEKGTNTDPCKDDHHECVTWAGMSECDANPNYMLKYCRRACMVCCEGTNQFGIGQRIPFPSHPEYASTKNLIDKSIEFMSTVWTDTKYKRVRHKCRNQHEDCTFWAAQGECEANPNYMKLNCAPACMTCDMLDIRNRCPMGEDNECIWKPGDLNKLFENIVDDVDGTGEYLRYNAKAFSRPKARKDGSEVAGVERDGPWIVLLENFVTEEEADRLVAIGMKQGYERSTDVGKEKPDGSHESMVSDSRTSHNTWCQEESCYKDPLVAPVIERIANVTKTEEKNSEYLQLLQYEPGQYYKQHHDYIEHHYDMPCGVRILTLFIYLNDVEEGGGTHFPLYDVTVQPKKGNAVLWPSVVDHDPERKDHRTDHEALPVIKGVKYGANAWIHSRDFKRAFKMNCH
mmetsp:Transcript_14262/g.30238  ORF Transcript_14262/g.30238 Transcript_14262/m.30238 type:complete len:579 (-) Transcript_14262:193-1929(-)